MATDTEAEFRRGRIVAFWKIGDFHIEPERDAARRGLTLSEVSRFLIRSRRIPTLNNKGLQRAE